ncbi:carbohydrate ABC transporter permease [Phytoactinopolyspora halotolerans]|uniref:Carbohydrate ABC transporter permease n=1 Tax=Phytoactinopolyspora halotolerans TaxID=1981512 RepID=A0A6L9SF43_9ACTN|nr:carbohydrate ABC transporter permease [Phytoactinopolyspora halotolerans]NEE03131.1 carbohydrate ABC transporter permease [Phytoactinopolyspora halotolerans]
MALLTNQRSRRRSGARRRSARHDAATAERGSGRPRRRLGRLVVWVLLVGLSLLYAYPFFWMVMTSLTLRENIFAQQIVPDPVAWVNYAELFENSLIWDWLLNSVIITGTQVVVGTFVSILIAYGFARFEFPGRRVLFIVLLATMMLPIHITIVPLFVMFRDWGWLDTLLPFVVPPFLGEAAFSGGAFGIFLLRQFMMTLPRELDEAAKLDGAGSWRTLWLILVPLCKPAIATVAVFAFLGTWNDFFAPFILLTSPEKLTMAVGMQFYKTDEASEVHLLMGMGVLNILPIVLVFFVAQKYFVRGIALTGLKG